MDSRMFWGGYSSEEESQVVILVVVGSIPIGHPKMFSGRLNACLAQLVELCLDMAAVESSNLSASTRFSQFDRSLVQLEERRSPVPDVVGSIPTRPARFSAAPMSRCPSGQGDGLQIR